MRAPRSAWSSGATAVVIAAALVVAAAALSPHAAPITGYIGGGGVVLLAVAVWFGVAPLVGPATACVLIACAVSIAGASDAARVDAIAFGIGGLAAAELSYRSIERRRACRVPRSLLAREVARYAAIALGSAALGITLLTVATATAAEGFAIVTVGAAAVVALTTLAAVEARRTGR